MSKIIVPGEYLMATLMAVVVLILFQWGGYKIWTSNSEMYSGPCEFVEWNDSKSTSLKATVKCGEYTGYISSGKTLNKVINDYPDALNDCTLNRDKSVSCNH